MRIAGIGCGLLVLSFAAFAVLPNELDRDDFPSVDWPLLVVSGELPVDAVAGAFTMEAMSNVVPPDATAGARGDGIADLHSALAVRQFDDGLALRLTNRPADAVIRFEWAGMPTLPMPQIGWMRRWGQVVSYDSAADCARVHADEPKLIPRCETWYAEQDRNREQWRASFIRGFELTHSDELREFGAPSSSELPRPTRLPIWRATDPVRRDAGGVLFLPWSAWPWTDDLKLQSLFLRVSICSAVPTVGNDAGTKTTSCRVIGSSATESTRDSDSVPRDFLRLRLPYPRSYRVSACDLPLRGDWEPGFGWWRPGFFLPTESAVLDVVLTLHPPASSYQDEPGGRSPEPRLTDFASVELGADEHLCSPRLIWVRDGQRIDSEEDIYQQPFDGGSLPPPLDVRAIDGDQRLVILGPVMRRTATGEGMCGACPRYSVVIWYLDRVRGELHRALWLDEMVEGFEDGGTLDMQLSEDGRQLRQESRACRYDSEDAEVPMKAKCAETVIDWCLPEGQRDYRECARTETPISESEL